VNYKCDKSGTFGYNECTTECTTSSDDCHGWKDGSTEKAYDSDNYECISGLCNYTGCNNDNECIVQFGSRYGCREMDFFTVKANRCTALCTKAADGVTSGSSYTENNYECINSTCIIKQCESDQWCSDTMGSDYICYEL
jgi:hypothetical protein